MNYSKSFSPQTFIHTNPPSIPQDVNSTTLLFTTPLNDTSPDQQVFIYYTIVAILLLVVAAIIGYLSSKFVTVFCPFQRPKHVNCFDFSLYCLRSARYDVEFATATTSTKVDTTELSTVARDDIPV